uniref:Putative secreted protein n=1 Tax=Rhipicephalus microplus TaxID=6941 RepID=A0A6M2D9V1_RHIMP
MAHCVCYSFLHITSVSWATANYLSAPFEMERPHGNDTLDLADHVCNFVRFSLTTHFFFFPRAHKSIAVAAFFIAHRPNFIEKTASGMGSRRIATGHGAFVGSRRVELTKNGQCVFLFIVPSRSRCTYCCFFFLL